MWEAHSQQQPKTVNLTAPGWRVHVYVPLYVCDTEVRCNAAFRNQAGLCY